jgi:catechol 2,3-dioxygenase-like lactoylglutathione lyase family enzyme
MSISQNTNNSKVSQIEHIVLCINNFDTTILFYTELLNFLGFEIILDKIYEDQRYVSFNNGIFDIGFISPQKDYLNSKFYIFQVGLSHLALKVDNYETLQKCCDICKKYNLNIENLGDTKIHHLEDFKTLRFYCPSGLLIELITK